MISMYFDSYYILVIFYYDKYVFWWGRVEEPVLQKDEMSRLFYLEIYDRNVDKLIFVIWPSYHTI